MQTDRRLFLALRGLYNYCDNLEVTEKLAPIYREADQALSQFELEMGPLPDWAEDHNIAQEPVQYAQLCTRDGKRCGNAIISLVTVPPSADCEVYYHVITDMGNEMRLTLRELNEMFEVGPYINKEYGIELRKRQNWSRAMGELGPDE